MYTHSSWSFNFTNSINIYSIKVSRYPALVKVGNHFYSKSWAYGTLNSIDYINYV